MKASERRSCTMSLCYQSEHHRGNAAQGKVWLRVGTVSAVLAGAPTYAMALDWDYRACVPWRVS
jgi:hypothetical protein